MTLGARTQKECRAWAKAVALDPEVIERAVANYATMIARDATPPPSDGDIAQSLTRLRRGVDKDMKDPHKAAERAQHLDDMAARLERSIAHTQTIEEAGFGGEVPFLKGRLEATLDLIKTLRAALARRAK